MFKTSSLKILFFIISVLFVSVLSCSKNKRNEKSKYLIIDSDTLQIKNIIRVSRNIPYKDSIHNLFLELENYSILLEKKVPQMTIRLKDSVYSLKGVKMFFSRELPDSELIYFYDNKTKKIIIDTINERPMFLIWPSSYDYHKLYNDLIFDKKICLSENQ